MIQNIERQTKMELQLKCFMKAKTDNSKKKKKSRIHLFFMIDVHINDYCSECFGEDQSTLILKGSHLDLKYFLLQVKAGFITDFVV